MTERLQNFGETTLAEDLDASEVTVTVTAGSVFPSSGNYRVVVDDEIMLVTARSTNDLTVTRGAESTAAAAHSNGTAIKLVLTAAGLTQAIGELGIPRGTSNPGSPATSDLFYRTDLGLIIFYDGTRWLTINEFTFNPVPRAASGSYSATTTLGTSIVRTAGNDLWVTRVRWSFYVATTLNGSNYWTLSGIGSSLVLNTGYSPDTFYGVDVTVGAAWGLADFLATKTAGSPGGITVGYEVFCRRIVT